jgi:hypothetical protein
MTRRTKILVRAAMLFGVLVPFGAASAADWGTVSAYGAIARDYRFRGISRSNRAWAPQAQVNWNISDGF